MAGTLEMSASQKIFMEWGESVRCISRVNMPLEKNQGVRANSANF